MLIFSRYQWFCFASISIILCLCGNDYTLVIYQFSFFFIFYRPLCCNQFFNFIPRIDAIEIICVQIISARYLHVSASASNGPYVLTMSRLSAVVAFSFCSFIFSARHSDLIAQKFSNFLLLHNSVSLRAKTLTLNSSGKEVDLDKGFSNVWSEILWCS